MTKRTTDIHSPHHTGMRLSLFALPVFSIILFGLFSCSETKNLAEDELLYTGIKEITWNGVPKKYKKKEKNDSTGVITSIAGAVDAVSDVLSGNAPADITTLLPQNPRTKEEEEALKAQSEADMKAFDVAREEVEAVLSYPPNNALFGSSSLRSPFPTGLWAYNAFVNKKGGLGKWMFKTLASTPVYISNVSPDMRVRVATNTLHNYGYFSGKVSHTLLPQKNPKKAKIAYEIHAGRVHRLDSIQYKGFVGRADSLIRATQRESLLKKGDPFNVVNLSNEQLRIEKLFRENGYYYYSAPYTTYLADTLQRPSQVQLIVSPSPERPARVRHPWYIGSAYISMRKNARDPLDKTEKRRYYSFSYSGEKMPLRAGMWRRAMSHRHGEIFRLSDSKSTMEKLGAMGVFSQIDVNYVPQDTTSACDTLDVYLSGTIDKLYDSSFEMNATMKSNQQIGPGVSYSIAKRNAFRGGEKVAFKIFGSYEWQTRTSGSANKSLLNSYELGTELSLEFPRFIIPFVKNRRLRMPSSTTFALSGDWKNRAKFFQMITFGTDITYKWHKHSSTHHELTAFSFEFDKLLHKTAEFEGIMNENPALYISMRDQFVPSASYTITYNSATGHRNPVWLQFSVKEAGNIVSGLYAASGKKFSTRDKDLFGSPFAQFVKFTLEGHETFKLNSRLSLATRLYGGVIYSYGNSLHAPYADLFYVGGANSIRAFSVRSVGPGSFKSDNGRYSYIDQTGDIKLEANAELRAKLFGSLHGAVFLDAGNIWLMRDDPLRPGGRFSASNLKHIAVGTGAGLRYDLDFLVLRFDVGLGLHAPYETSKSGFYNLEHFKDGFAFHFAIGYPF